MGVDVQKKGEVVIKVAVRVDGTSSHSNKRLKELLEEDALGSTQKRLVKVAFGEYILEVEHLPRRGDVLEFEGYLASVSLVVHSLKFINKGLPTTVYITDFEYNAIANEVIYGDKPEQTLLDLPDPRPSVSTS